MKVPALLLDKDEFTAQMKRIVEVYGEKCYSPERLHRIYMLMNRCYIAVFQQVVTRLIDTRRAAPLPQDFLIALDEVERENDKSREGNIEALSAAMPLHRAADAIRDPRRRELAQGRCKLIRDYQTGEIDEEQFEAGKLVMDTASRELDDAKCRRCDDLGILCIRGPGGEEYRARCGCPSGSMHAGPMYAPSDRCKQKPEFLPLASELEESLRKGANQAKEEK